MNTSHGSSSKPYLAIAILALVFAQDVTTANAASTDIADVPMAVKNSVTPNVLVIYDNSQSMDAYMAGSLVAGSDPNTRGNIGRQVMRNAITSYRTAFNWGLMSYGLSGTPGLYNTWAYYLGSDTGMVFTDQCTGYVAGAAGTPPTLGTSALNGKRCIANPDPFSGGAYLTFDKMGDDPDIQDVLYDTGTYSRAWALTTGSGTNYQFYGSHKVSAGDSWTGSSFSGDPFGCGNCSISFTPTDAGFLPSYPSTTRQLYLSRAWGYLSNITGAGKLNEPVQADSAAHYNNLIALLGNETNGSTGEIKNGAVFTPLKGTLDSAKTYFSSSYQSKTSPIAYSCQQNFVMLVTDGLPTGNTSGNLYSASDRTNSCVWSTTTNACTSGSFGVAATDAINSVTALRSTANANNTTPYDIQTYVVALGNTVANANALAVMNAMANAGGTGSALLATDAASFQSAMTTITNDVTAKVGAAAAVAVANAHVTSTDNASFASSYNSGTWAGDLNSYSIDVTTGQPTTTSLWTSGSAQAQLDSRTAASRLIVTSTDVAGTRSGVQFQPTTATTTTKLSTAQQTLLNTSGMTPADGAAVLAYLRGDRSGETAGTYRVRAHLLGDIVNAEPLVVRAPSASYADAGYYGSSTTFKESNANRTRMVYQGANDGMLHAFNATTGAEVWAYVPNSLLASLNNLSSKANFVHKYYVDGTPVAGDVDFKNTDGATGGGTDWHTILVGGLGKGGRAYYALDVTSTNVPDEATAAGKVLWEFPTSVTNATQRNAAILNTGYTFGKPIIVKTKAKGWVVLVTSGYNNGTNTNDSGGDGLGHLFVLNPRTGDLISDIPTSACATTPTANPCGLAQISAYVNNTNLDNTTDFVYGGDLMGNVWRFDLSGANANSWSATKFAVLKDAAGATQPVTTTPELATIAIGGVSTRFVYVGTGLYLGNTDIPGASGANSHASQTQTMYGLIDTTTGTLPNPLRGSLQVQTLTTSGSTRTVTNNTVDFTTVKGWYVDLPDTGERISTDPALALGALVFTSNIPNSTICVPGGSSWLYFLNYKTGGKIDRSTVSWSGTKLGNVLASRPVLVQLPSGKVVVLVRTSDALTQKQDAPLPSSSGSGKRISWRELVDY